VTLPLAGIAAAVITVSDRAASGEYDDRSGPLAVELLLSAGAQVSGPVLVADEVGPIQDAVRSALASGARLILTSGGTGVGPRDRTPEAVAPLLRLQVPGVAEAIRAAGRDKTPMADLSRGIAGVADGGFVVTLPGSTGAVRDGVGVVVSLAAHLLEQIDGGDH
jgi:molybdenum cofactor biosynthesis protein B